MKPIALEDFLQYRFLSALSYAPGGERAAFVVSRCNEEDNCYDSELWLYDGALRRLADLGGGHSFLWKDATHILFQADRTKKEQELRTSGSKFTSYYELDVLNGAIQHMFTLHFPVLQMEKLENGYLAIGVIDAAYPDYYAMSEAERERVQELYQEEADYVVLDEFPFCFNGKGVTNKKRNAIFMVSESGDAKRITEPLYDTEDYAVLGGKVYFCGHSYSAVQPFKDGKIYRADLATGEVMLAAACPELKVERLQKVGSEIWASASACERYGYDESRWIYRLCEEKKTLEVVREEECSMRNTVGSDCRYGVGSDWQVKSGSLYHLTTRSGDSNIYRLDADGVSTPVITKTGSVDAFALCEEKNTALMLAMYDNRLQELYEADLTSGQIRCLSSFNDEILRDKYVAGYQKLNITSGGFDIDGWVLLPRDYDPGKKYPAILDVHGGARCAYGPVFYHEMQVWASMGYFVFFCNPIGSDGRDNEFMHIRGCYGEKDYVCIMQFTDAVLEAYPQIDRARVCMTGGSYGGYMANWIIGHTDRFCCVASQRSISNWVSMYGSSDVGAYYTQDECMGDPFNGVERMWKQSPLSYAANAKTPTLFIHSVEDYRCPLEQALQMFTALQVHGVPTRLCIFRGENHELSRSGKPKHRVRRLREITNWFAQYAK